LTNILAGGAVRASAFVHLPHVPDRIKLVNIFEPGSIKNGGPA
jgi:hypothetical protein